MSEGARSIKLSPITYFFPTRNLVSLCLNNNLGIIIIGGDGRRRQSVHLGRGF